MQGMQPNKELKATNTQCQKDSSLPRGVPSYREAILQVLV